MGQNIAEIIVQQVVGFMSSGRGHLTLNRLA